jgi:hypothetical protein
MLESVELVVAALVAGAATGVGDSASAAVRDGYEGLKSLTRRALRRAATAEELSVVEAGLVDPERHREMLAEVLSAADVDGDEELVAAARWVLELTGHTEAGKYQGVVVRDNRGVQVGDHNTQTNTFTS